MIRAQQLFKKAKGFATRSVLINRKKEALLQMSRRAERERDYTAAHSGFPYEELVIQVRPRCLTRLISGAVAMSLTTSRFEQSYCRGLLSRRAKKHSRPIPAGSAGLGPLRCLRDLKRPSRQVLHEMRTIARALCP